LVASDGTSGRKEMTDWQWQVILAIIRLLLWHISRFNVNVDYFRQYPKDVALLQEALKREKVH